MPESTTTETKETRTNPLVTAQKALLDASKKKLEEAKKAKSENSKNLTQTKSDLEAKNKSVVKSKSALTALEEVKTKFDTVNRASNNAAAIAANVAGDAVAQSITDAAKLAKTALDSIEVTYPAASALHARVTNVDVVSGDDSKATNALVTATRDAADAIEKWKNNWVELAMEQSSFLNKDVVETIAKFPDLVTAVGAVGSDIDTTVSETEATLAADKAASAELQTSLDAIKLANLQSDLIIATSKDFTETTKPKITKSEGTSKSKK